MRSHWWQSAPEDELMLILTPYPDGGKKIIPHLQAWGKGERKIPQKCPELVTSCSCRSSSRWRTSFSAAATTFLRFCRKFCSSVQRSNPRRASRFLGLKHRPWVLRPGHRYCCTISHCRQLQLCLCVFTDRFVDYCLQYNIINGEKTSPQMGLC